MVQLSLAPVNNQDLFSKHFLEDRLPEKDVWDKEEEIEETFGEIRSLYEDEKDVLSSLNEPQLEEHFIRKIFKKLGQIYEIEETVERGSLRPDYGFFKNKADRSEAHKHKGKDDFFKKSIAIGDAKAWGTSLDKKTTSGRVEYKRSNPSWQIYIYLKETPASWGILTDGRYWRLYNEETADKLDVYYEVDLVQILEEGDLEKFKYFYYFFRQEAFTEDKSGQRFLDKIYQESDRYAESVGRDLEKRVYKALRWMAEGYFEIGTNNLDKNEENLDKVHRNSLIFLYRLIFVLYAESNGLLTKEGESLPTEYSINKVVDEILDDLDNGEVERGGLYGYQVNQVFNLIDKGSDGVGLGEEDPDIPAYNGGLFSDEKYPFLEDKKIGNRYLAKVIELLARTEEIEGKDKARIDYSDLSIRHIGGIYEGLLEYNLELAEEHMVTVKRSGNQKWEKKSETDRKNFYDEAEEGEIYLVTDEGDRKVTGSYYTPDYIVKRMVEDSLEPKVQEKLNQVSDELGGEEERKKKKEAILSINVCDPAMGSGHFLVEATEFLAQHLTPYIHEEEEENDIDIAKREIVKNCIYGVDVNDLATELSKVSLWLNTISENKPLSFLDHHLKTGNSLLNANLENLDEHPEKKDEKEEQEGRNEGLWAFTDSDKSKIEEEISEMVDKFEEIQTQEESSREDIQKEENLYNEFKDSEFREKVKLLLDTYLSYWFGNEYSEEEYDEIVKSIELDNGDIDFISEEEKVKKAKDVSKKRDFFHWEIEFPDVFLELGQNGNSSGFDIVIGNPPYVSNWNLSDSDSEMVDALEKIYPDVTTGHWDLFVPFVKQSLDLTSEDGRHTFILPTSFGMEKYGRKVREHILDNHYLENLTEFGEFKAFGQEVDRLFMTYLIQKNERSGETEIWKYDTEHGFDKKGVISQSKFSRLPNNTLRTDVTDLDFQIKDKVDDISIKLGNICVVNVGVVAHSSSDSELDFKKNDVIHSEQKAGFEKYVEGSDISRYQINWGGEYLDYDDKREHFHRPKYPELFTPEKLLISRVSSEGGRISSCLDSEGYYTNDNTIIAKIWSKDVLEQQKPKEDWYVDDRKKEYDHSFISGLVNSSLLTYIFTKFFATDTLQGSYSGIYPEDARNLPLLLEVDEETKEEISETVSRITELNSEIADESSGFLRWIEREWGTDIEKLSRKTYLKKFWKHGFDDDRKSILKIAKHNSSELEIDPSSLDFQEQLENEWSDKVETLREKEEKIEKLDIGLDALVLEAYGLSEREARKTLEAMTFSEDKKEKIIKIKEKMENEDTLEVLE